MKALIIFAAFLLSSVAFAGWAEDFEVLKDIPRDYQNIGNICEEVGRLQVQREFPEPEYTVDVGISYDFGGGTIGELDLIVFDNQTGKVVSIGEVKCWQDLRAGLKKAKEQRTRFVRANSSKKSLTFKSTSSERYFEASQFRNVTKFFSMAQKGGKAAGFSDELEYSLGEMHEHRKDMMRCQSQKICVKP